jgi:uncharacterized protein YdeI (YjbR/CyaY-like superfamily)
LWDDRFNKIETIIILLDFYYQACIRNAINWNSTVIEVNRMNPKVDVYLIRAKKWQEEMEKLRRIILDCQLTEELKWGKPCYTFQKSNIVLIVGFKEYCALIFCKGALLNDTNGI